ncbi:MAG TPA: lysophospholipid acyltransferase family protein [Fredinandcohnia sp.]|nr:lysophospholipid acyltransferase family protein [Fredinandcohnia sp.]
MKSLAWMVINLVQGVLLIAWTIVCVGIVIVSRLLGREWPLRVPRLWSWLLLRLGGIRLQVEREAEIDWSKAHVYVMNHQSMVDILAAFLAIPVPIRFIAKRVLAHVPFLGWYMRAMGMVFVDRSRTAQAVASMQQAEDLLRAGANIIAFPEGTRSIDGRIRPFKKGAFMVALHTGTPIVPMAIHGARDVLPPGTFRARPGVVRLRIGAPIPTEGLGSEHRDALIARVRTEILRMHREIGGPGGDATQHVAGRGERAAHAAPPPPAEVPEAERRMA